MTAAMQGSRLLDRAIALVQQYTTSSELSELDEAVSLLETAVRLMPDGYADLPQTYAALVGVYTQRFMRLDNADDRQRAQQAAATGVRRLGATPGAAPIWSNVASLMRVAHQRTGSLADLNASIDAARAAKRAWTEAGIAIHPMTHATLASSVLLRFTVQQHIEDLSEAVDHADAAIEAARKGHPDRLSALGVVVNAYRLHYEFTGSMRSLTVAVELQEELSENVPPGHVEEGTHLATLAMTYLLRYDRLGSMSDIDTALTSLSRIVHVHDATISRLALVMRARALLHRVEHLAEADRRHDALADAHRAIDDADAALAITSTVGSGQIRGRHVAANAWLAVANLTDAGNAAKRAREHLEAALSSADPDENARRMAMIVLANITLVNKHISSTAQQVAEAFAYLRGIIATTEEDNPIFRTAVASLIGGLLAHGPEDDGWAGELMELLDRLAASGPTSAAVVVAAAAEIGAAMTERGDSRGAEAYRVALRLLPTATWLGLDRRSQERHLTRLPNIARHAAAAHLAKGEAGQLEALCSLEQGRTVLWSQLGQLQNSDPRLAEYPAFAEALAEVAGAITALNQEILGDVSQTYIWTNGALASPSVSQ